MSYYFALSLILMTIGLIFTRISGVVKPRSKKLIFRILGIAFVCAATWNEITWFEQQNNWLPVAIYMVIMSSIAIIIIAKTKHLDNN